MEPMARDVQTLRDVLEMLREPFWWRPEFWAIATLELMGGAIGVAGLVFAIKAFREARRAKRAATEAGRTDKVPTIAIELTEISHKPDKLKMDLLFGTATDLLSQLSCRACAVFSA